MFSDITLDDVLREVFKALLERGAPVTVTRGETLELTAVHIELQNPLARLSRSETRGMSFSCLGELCWYLAGEKSLAFIEYYIPLYRAEATDGKMLGAYGPRLFPAGGGGQIDTILKLLQERPTTRQAVVQLFAATDLITKQRDVPCTCTLQFLVRDGALTLITHMRSNDAVKGLTHDIFAFTMLQELVARSLSVKLGTYHHIVGSLHLYCDGRNDDRIRAREFIDEGYQSTKLNMPPMPEGDQFPHVQTLLVAEHSIRLGGTVSEEVTRILPPYWKDLVRLLEAYRAKREGRFEDIAKLKTAMASDVYSSFLTQLG